MATSIYASSVTITRQSKGGFPITPFRCDIHDPTMNVSGLGFGNTEREAFYDAKLNFQKQATWAVDDALARANEGFARIQK